jgi:TPP-dependent pyruvate/acetoin dehydrogenase alpha subunit
MNFDNLYEELFFKALRIRLVEGKIIELYPTDKIQSPVHLSVGQEAVAVGVCQELKVKDLIFSNNRGHGYYLAKGGDLKEFFAELYGKSTGCCRGKGGSMHLAAPEVGLMGASALVASTIAHAVGAAMAAKKLKKEQIIIAVFGDGATDEGVYHESLNFAALHKLPIIFVCENNGLAVHTRTSARQSYKILDHAATYGFPTHYCAEGYDIKKVHEVFSPLVAEVRATQLPQYIEIKTCRYLEHVGVNEDYDTGYRSINEINEWKQRDPLIFEKKLIDKYTPSIAAEIEEAVIFAENSPWPQQEDLLIDVI